MYKVNTFIKYLEMATVAILKLKKNFASCKIVCNLLNVLVNLNFFNL